MNLIFTIFKSINKGIKDWKNSPEKICKNCRDQTLSDKVKYKCHSCRREICDNCKIDPLYLAYDYTCRDCDRRNIMDFMKVSVVKSEHIGGHNILEQFKLIKSEFSSKDFDNSTNNLKYLALKIGANGIINFKQEKKKYSRGNYIYSKYSCSGIPVKIEKK